MSLRAIVLVLSITLTLAVGVRVASDAVRINSIQAEQSEEQVIIKKGKAQVIIAHPERGK